MAVFGNVMVPPSGTGATVEPARAPIRSPAPTPVPFSAIEASSISNCPLAGPLSRGANTTVKVKAPFCATVAGSGARSATR